MNILTISGSAQKESRNEQFLKAIPTVIAGHQFTHFNSITDFPLFNPQLDNTPPEIILSFKQQLVNADMVIISTPEYVYNIPAVLKNALEWITSSGELYNKKVIAITYTPNTPRGEKAMQSLLWSLQALSAKIIAELPLYQSDLKVSKDGTLQGDEAIESIKTLFDFIK